MATNILEFPRLPANDDEPDPPPPFTLSVALRKRIIATVEYLIAVLDHAESDPDCEDDDPTGQCDEDGINTAHGPVVIHGLSMDGPGCPIGDPGEDVTWAHPDDHRQEFLVRRQA
jgi:hypothetical protein